MEFKDYKPDSKVLSNQDILKKDKKDLEKWKNPEREPESTIKVIRNSETMEIPAEETAKEPKINRRAFLKLGIVAAGSAAISKIPFSKKLENFSNNKELTSKIDMSVNEQAPEIKIKQSLKKETYEREHMLPEQILKEFVKTFEKEKRFSQQIPRDIFSDNFFIAQQFSESRYNKEDESHMKARGIFQNRVESVVEVSEYLSELQDKGLIKNYNGPIDISRETAEKMHQLLDKDDDYGRATGKLYDICMWDPDYKYNPGNKRFKNKSITDTQRYIYAQYIEGPKARLKKPSDWLPSTKPYVKNNMKLMLEILAIRKEFELAGHDPGADFDVVEVLRETDRKENRGKDIVAVAKEYLKDKGMIAKI
ncbi:hypothetical protein KAR28_04570 [Candidatus Parcubacteria bacterium]|nr:hypothetical protein [Candidatus Parcubacteria bacterium]